MRPARIGADLKVTARSYLRNPIAMFFSLIFPIILIGLFGLIFSGSSGPITLYVVNADKLPNGQFTPTSVAFLQALNDTKVVKVQIESQNPAGFATWLANNSYTVGLVIPAGFESSYQNHSPVNLTLYTDPADTATAGPVSGAVAGVQNAFNLRLAGSPPVVGTTDRQVGSQVFKYVDYLVPGLIGFSILTSPMFSMVDITSSYRKDGLFRQLSLTPLTRAEWLTSRIIWYVILTFVSAGIMIVMAYVLFGAHVTVSLGMLPFLFAGPFFFVSLGMLAGSVSKSPETAAVIGNVITFPMMFLSGTFFPVSSFNAPLQAFAHILPLYYVIDGMNQVMLFGSATRAFSDFLVVLVGSVVIFLAAISLFKWRDE